MDINKRINKIAEKFFEGNNVKFASRMDTSEANIRNYRSKTIPKIDFIIKLHNELEISFDWILLGDTMKAPDNYLEKNDHLNAAAEEESNYTAKDEVITVLKDNIKAQQKTITAQDKTIHSLEELLKQSKSNENSHSHASTRTVSGQLERQGERNDPPFPK